jgi:hypothetical protein
VQILTYINDYYGEIIVINLIPTAKVIFRDGDEEEATNVFMFSNKHYIVCTNRGIYMVDDRKPIRKYDPRYIIPIPFINGHVEYDHSNCWIVDDLVECIELNYCPFRK